MSVSGHSPHRGPGLAELPELSLPELRASEMFSTDPSTSHLDLSFTASSYMFQNSSGNDPRELGNFSAYHEPTPMRTSDGAASADGDGDGENRHHGQTQKAMLSKALQKANTAVLLDNAANFEGAMEAYTDACQLLQLVMLRSNGGDEEKIKLQEIVSRSDPKSLSGEVKIKVPSKLTYSPARYLYDTNHRTPAHGLPNAGR